MLKCHRAARYVLLVGQQLLEENAITLMVAWVRWARQLAKSIT
jgi:hypothetical protein